MVAQVLQGGFRSCVAHEAYVSCNWRRWKYDKKASRSSYDVWVRFLPGFYRIWYTARQLDIVVQHIMSTMLNHLFLYPLVALIGYLRMQINLSAEMGSKCSSVSTARWNSMATAKIWILYNRDRVKQYLDEKTSAVTLQPL